MLYSILQLFLFYSVIIVIVRRIDVCINETVVNVLEEKKKIS